jgi:hypothetical protein
VREQFSRDLPEGVDLRPVVTRLRALVTHWARPGIFNLPAGTSVEQAVQQLCLQLVLQLRGENLLGSLPPDPGGS